MKKIVLPFFTLFLTVFLFTCENEPLDPAFETEVPSTGASFECLTASQAYAVATLNFSTWDGVSESQYTTLCTALTNAIQGVIDTCGDPDNNLQTLLGTYGDCSEPIDPDSCEGVTIAVSVAANNYNNATEEFLSQACNVYILALQDQIDVCGDADGSIQATIDALGDCSSTTGSNLVLLKKVVHTYSATETFTSEFTYEGNKIKTVVFTDVDGGNTQTETETYIYENEILKRVDYEYSGSSDNYEEFEYNSSNQLINTILYNPSLNEAQKWEYTYNTDGTILVKSYTGDLTSQTDLLEEYTLTFENGNLISENFVNSSYTHSYDNMNGYFKNIHQRDMLNIHFAGGVDLNNPTSANYTDGAGNSETETTSYTYNSDNYPESSTTSVDGVEDFTSVYTYY
ncbi:hypothetical protein CLV86_0469 [Lacinutrix venerupis]|uniref:hypothetical protein n=1 Tax=Lacinutrix venerupis TaxID=1486034 RepID=UPI000EB502D5|nr:hypothetical protein [Lacinutrix venerupis]RLJ69076.1 hypothetical protein CLV86_0469 [Lacinutrix venerupis]